jgi:hypothetical protein
VAVLIQLDQMVWAVEPHLVAMFMQVERAAQVNLQISPEQMLRVQVVVVVVTMTTREDPVELRVVVAQVVQMVFQELRIMVAAEEEEQTLEPQPPEVEWAVQV